MSELTREQLLIAIISGRGPAHLPGVDLSKLDLSGAGWLMEADLWMANLSSANLSKANLRASNMEKANLAGSVLVGAILEGADLRNARLTAANLKMANLQGAFLQGANLVGAVLAKANLQEANLEGADLEGADLEGANIRGAILTGANLKLAKIQEIPMKSYLPESASFEGFSQGISPPISQRGFTGTLNGIELAELLQLVCLSRSDRQLLVESPWGHGVIEVFCGKICHAETGDLRGEDAFYKIVGWVTGSFEARSLDAPPQVSIEKPIEHLLVESYRLRDELESSWNEDLAS
ncbi:MAG: pentapeptide repeat-containing protein [Syntrophobacteraceae bacterium]